jgi:hypothetical protein
MLKPTTVKPSYDEPRRAIGFWMRDDDEDKPVRICVTCEGLWALNPSMVRDLDSAFKLFDEQRAHIEEVANDRLSRGEDFDGEHEGHRLMILRGDDIAPKADTNIT